MSYQVLARKWRPKNFEQLMGQEHVVTVLVNALNQERLHHAYLFTGTRGVGKTTIARIFAKSLNCETGITATPCGKCDVCLDIDQGRFIDLLEIDAASRTKVDDTREILDNVQYAPSRGRYKVYLIDEVHMLSRSSFNALLKTLEEPPEHVKFILATTDPQKLPVTVLSRCLQFHLKALTSKQIEQQLASILVAENVSHEAGALTLIAKSARGSMRDSLSLTDQAIAQGQGNISVSNVQQMLGGVDHNWPFKLLVFLLKQDTQNLMALVQEIASYAPSYPRLLADLIQLLHQIALAQVVEQKFDLSPEQTNLLIQFSQTMSPEDVQLYYQIVLNGRKDLPYAADEQAAFDMTILRLLAFKPMTLADAVNNSAELSSAGKPASVNQLSVDELAATKVSHTEPTVELAPSSLSTEQLKPVPSITVTAASSSGDFSTDNLNGSSISGSSIDEPAAKEFLDTEPEQPLAQVLDQTSQMPELQTQQVSQQTPQQPTETKVVSSEAVTSVDAILAERNMLRSRRKAQETGSKKSNDAELRQASLTKNQPLAANEPPQLNVKSKLPVIASLAETPFSPEVIDPAQIRHANQVDKWANMIDSMALGGRLRQLAIHATVDKNSTDDYLLLNLDQSTKHLISDNAYQQLEQKLTELLGRIIRVEVNIVAETQADPYKIQGQINDKRYQYAKELLAQDEIIKTLQHDYQATLDESTIKAL
jgi:DNA polymerase III subunit gamma/tau